MRNKVRNLIFSAFLILFLVGGAYLVIIAQGWVLDFHNLKIIRTGGIFLKFSPSDAELVVNGSPRTFSVNLLSPGILIKDLTLNKYDVRLTKAGFLSWEKYLTVKAGIVTAATAIKLWPDMSKYETIVSSTIDDFWLTNRGMVSKNNHETIQFQGHLLKGRNVILADSRSAYLITTDGQNYFLTNLDNPEAALNLSELFNSLKQRQLHFPGIVPIKAFFLHPFNKDKLILMTEGSLYSLDLNKLDLTQILNGQSLSSFSQSGNEVFAVSKSSGLVSGNLILKTTDTVPFGSSTTIRSIEADTGAGKIFLTNDLNELIAYDRQSKNSAKIADNVKEFHPAPDNKKVALISPEGKVSLLFLENYEDDFKEPAGANLALALPESNETSDLIWLTKWPGYILFKQGGNLILSEIDPRPPLNFYTVITNAKKYILDGNNLYVLRNSGDLLKFNLGQ